MEKNLEKFSANILKWYDFNNRKSILQIGKDDNITQYLKSIFDKVEIIEKEDYVNEKFDYVLILNMLKIENYEKIILNNIEDDGKILMIGNNPLGINNFSKYHFDKDCYTQYIEKYNNSFDSITEIKEKMRHFGFKSNVYSVYPNYKNAELIFNENFNITLNQIEKYSPNINDDEIKIFNEIDVLKNIINNNKELLIHVANSYFLEASKNEKFCNIKYVSFNNVRKKEYRLITLITDECVEKKIAEEEAKIHLESIKENINDLKKQGFNILDYYDNEKIYSKFINNEKTLDEVLAINYKNKKFIVDILKNFENILEENAICYEECKDKIDYFEYNEKFSKLHFLEKCYWDLIPKNCFYIDNKFYFFDQEWEKNYLPVEFVIYRAIINCYELVKIINVDELFEELNLKEYKELFEEINKKLMEQVIDYNEINKKNIKAIDNYINDNKSQLEELERKQKYITELEKSIESMKLHINNIKKNNNTMKEHLKHKKYISRVFNKIKWRKK